MSDYIEVTRKLEVTNDKFADLSKLSDDELMKYLTDPKSFLKAVKDINLGNVWEDEALPEPEAVNNENEVKLSEDEKKNAIEIPQSA